jgi:voltage-gated sodium channel
MVLNLFIGVVVNAMQAEAEKGMAAEREAERELVHGEAEPILAEVRRLRSDLAQLRKDLAVGAAKPGG